MIRSRRCIWITKRVGLKDSCSCCLSMLILLMARQKTPQGLFNGLNSMKFCDMLWITNSWTHAYIYIYIYIYINIVGTRYQQGAFVSSAGVQPHYSPCLNETESVPCDSQDRNASLRWDNHPKNRGWCRSWCFLNEKRIYERAYVQILKSNDDMFTHSFVVNDLFYWNRQTSI